jgi:pimeloyl-ACP methyl ester carboxylesterase
MRNFTFAAIVAAVALTAVACGDDDTSDGAGPATTDAAETTEAPTAAEEPVATEAPATTEEPVATEAPATTDAPDTTEAPESEGVDLSDLAVAAADLEASVACGAAGDAGTLLLVHGTGSTPAETFGPSLSATLPPFGYEVCTVELPGRSTVDIQDSTEYVVGAIRTITARTGEPLALVGYSQGVLQSRGALAFWPDIADDVAMLVAIGGPNAGTPAVEALCAEGCVPALWQMAPGSGFLTALDAAWSESTVPVTAIRTLTDEFVPPESGAAIPDATVVTIQDWCPDRAVSHGAQLIDPIAHAGIVSALANGGTATEADLEAVGCDETVVAGSDLDGIETAAADAFGAVLGGEFVDAEPAVRLG